MESMFIEIHHDFRDNVMNRFIFREALVTNLFQVIVIPVKKVWMLSRKVLKNVA